MGETRHERRRALRELRHRGKHPNPPPTARWVSEDEITADLRRQGAERDAEDARVAAMTDDERDAYMREHRRMLGAVLPAMALLAGGMDIS